MAWTPPRQHLELLWDATVQLGRTPVATSMTVTVLAIALALPATLLLITRNLEHLIHQLEAPGTLTLFLDKGVAAEQRARIRQRLRRQEGVVRVSYTSPETALREASELLDLGDALEGLPMNPLPGSFEVVLAPGHRSPAQMEGLSETFSAWTGVDQVQYDRLWVARFQAGVTFLRRAGHIAAVLLGGVVALIIGNTIRLAVLNRRQELEVVRLIGATTHFVRLPFLYAGTVQGGLAGLLAGILVAVAMDSINASVGNLVSQYGGEFVLHGPEVQDLFWLLVSGSGLAWLSSRLTVGWHIREIDPT